MKEQETKAILAKYLPSKSEFFKRCGYAWLASLIIGIGYGYLFMELSIDLPKEDESQFRLGMGFMHSLPIIFVSTVALSISYWVKVYQAKKKAIIEVASTHVNKN